MKAIEAQHQRGQSLWLDNITRAMLDVGKIQHYIDAYPVTGLTSNPSIFDKAITLGGYDDLIRAKTACGLSGEGVSIIGHAGAGQKKAEVDAETTPPRDPSAYQFDIDVAAVAEVWRTGSVVGSWLMDLTADAFARPPGLDDFTGRESDSGEGRWTLDAAIDTGVPAPVIAAALLERFESRGGGELVGKVLSAMRSESGGHAEKKG